MILFGHFLLALIAGATAGMCVYAFLTFHRDGLDRLHRDEMRQREALRKALGDD